MGCSLKWNTDLVCKSFFEMIFLSVILLFIFFFWACRLRRRRPVPSPRPGVVCPQSHKKSFLRSLFCGSGTSPPGPCGLSTYRLTPGRARGWRCCYISLLSVLIFFIVIRIVNSFHKHFAVVYFRGQCIVQKSFQNITFCRT